MPDDKPLLPNEDRPNGSSPTNLSIPGALSDVRSQRDANSSNSPDRIGQKSLTNRFSPESTGSAAGPPSVDLPSSLTERLRKLRDGLLTGLVERDVAIRLALLAALAGEHLLLLGPPGTAKSLIARRLHLAFSDSTYFERLLTRFTVPEELFGPLSIKGLEEDRYERLTEAYLPKASIAFLDEIFKANSAILNALLTLLNEREFDNGTRRITTPLVAVIGASNEMPDGDELDALFDRFLLRLHVGPVSQDGFKELLQLRGHATPDVPVALKLSDSDLLAVRSAAERVEVPADVEALLRDLRDWCTAEEIKVSDRRWRKIVKLLQVSALTNGQSKASVWDCWLLQHCLWDRPEDAPKIYRWYAARVGASAAMDPSRLTKIVVRWEAALKAEEDSRSQVQDREGRPLYHGPDGKKKFASYTTQQQRRGKDLLYLAPATTGSADGIVDRTANGRGYTRDELDGLLIYERPYPPEHFRHWLGRDRYLANEANWLMENIEHPPLMEPTRHSRPYIDACLGQADQLRADVLQYKEQLDRHTADLAAIIGAHLWVTPDFATPAAENLVTTQRQVDTLLLRVETIRKGFEMLPAAQDRLGEDPPQATRKDPGGEASESGR